MKRKSLLGVGLVVAIAIGAASCDLVVTNFGGTKILMTMSGARPTPAGSHLEMWARHGDNEIIRMQPQKEGTAAYILVPAVDINDPCMVETGLDNTGNYELLWKPASQVGPSDAEKITQAAAVEARIHQLTDLQPQPMVALVAYDDNSVTAPIVCAQSQKLQSPMDKTMPIFCATDADCAVGFCGRPCSATESCQKVCVKRKEYCNCLWGVDACKTDWAKAPAPHTGNCPGPAGISPNIYTGDPRQLTHPIHGTFYGAVDFISSKPSQIAGGMSIETPFAVRDIRELWLTQTKALISKLDPDVIDCGARPDVCRGTTYLQGSSGIFGRGVIHFDLLSPDRSVAGTAAIYTKLGEDPVSF